MGRHKRKYLEDIFVDAFMLVPVNDIVEKFPNEASNCVKEFCDDLLLALEEPLIAEPTLSNILELELDLDLYATAKRKWLYGIVAQIKLL